MSNWLKNQPVYFTLPQRILDGNGDPVTTLVKADFDIQLGDPSAVDRVALVTLAHQAATPGLYGGAFTPDDDGVWRLAVQYDDGAGIVVDAVQEFIVGAASDYASSVLTDITAVRLYMAARSLAFTDNEIQQAIDWACAAIESYCNRAFASTVYTSEKYDGHDLDMLYLKHQPIISVSSVTVDDTAETDYEIEGGALFLEDGWAKGRRNIVVSYTAGYAIIPADVHMVCTRFASDLCDTEAISGAIQSEKIGDYSYTVGSTAAQGSVDSPLFAPYKQYLAPHRKITI